MAEQKQFDPGTGAAFNHSTKRIINKDGSFNVLREGQAFEWNDAYLMFIRMSWPVFILTLSIGFLIINGLFALAYWFLGDGHLVIDHEPNSLDYFLHCFYFSCQTFTTVGYGAISPTSHIASLIASFEAFFGFLSFSLATGLLFGRFSRPNAKIKYSKNALISKVNGRRALMFRIANQRPTPLLDLKATVILTFSIAGANDSITRKYHKVKLQVSHIDFFPLNWTIVHFIDEESPLFEYTNEAIKKINGEVLVHIKGFDETFSQEVHSRYSYRFNEIIPNARFLKTYCTDEFGEVTLHLEDLDKFEKTD